MGADTPVPNAKGRKIINRQNKNRIGTLPDTVLQHILSFLPMKDAAKTCILSKRWLYLYWIYVPDLSFEERSPGKRILFLNFVERVLALRDFSNIRKFSLSCDVLLGDDSRFDVWISGVVRHKVQELDLRLYCHGIPSVLPCCLFSCDSLTSLKLSMGNELKLPSFISFTNLKILNLTGIIFPGDHSTQQLFSGCPVLEELSIIHCKWGNVKAVCISAPMLGKLIINDEKPYNMNDEMVDQNFVHGCQVIISGTSLKTFSYIGELINEYFFYNSSSLVDAYIEMKVRHRDMMIPREVAYHAHKLLKGLRDVKSLQLSCHAFKALHVADELWAHLLMFYNLTSLRLGSHVTLKFHGAILNILRNLPCLNSLQFSLGIYKVTYWDKYDFVLDPVPSCF